MAANNDAESPEAFYFGEHQNFMLTCVMHGCLPPSEELVERITEACEAMTVWIAPLIQARYDSVRYCIGHSEDYTFLQLTDVYVLDDPADTMAGHQVLADKYVENAPFLAMLDQLFQMRFHQPRCGVLQELQLSHLLMVNRVWEQVKDKLEWDEE